MVLALYNKVKILRSLLSKRVVITRRKSQRKALNSLVAKSLKSSEGVKRSVLLLHEEEDLILELRRRRPIKVFGTENEDESVKHGDEFISFIFSLIIRFLVLREREKERDNVVVLCFWSLVAVLFCYNNCE